MDPIRITPNEYALIETWRATGELDAWLARTYGVAPDRARHLTACDYAGLDFVLHLPSSINAALDAIHVAAEADDREMKLRASIASLESRIKKERRALRRGRARRLVSRLLK